MNPMYFQLRLFVIVSVITTRTIPVTVHSAIASLEINVTTMTTASFYCKRICMISKHSFSTESTASYRTNNIVPIIETAIALLIYFYFICAALIG